MKLTMVAAVSLDEFIARSDETNISAWTSAEDKSFFSDIKSKHHLFIMGSKTYLSSPIYPTIGTLRIVMTTTPERYKNQQVLGQLEFVNLSAKDLVLKYADRFHEALVLGGSHIYQQFIDAKLVNEIYLTVEPIKHGNGVPLLSSGKKLKDVILLPKPKTAKLNSSGTMLKHYSL